jgi:hypothetical protein
MDELFRQCHTWKAGHWIAKVKYPSRRDARTVLKKCALGTTTYRCDNCGSYHVGRKPHA